jgi:microcystin degradation protein MlrC
VAHNISNAAVAINDPLCVERLNQMPPGFGATLHIGGRGSKLDAGPFSLAIEVISKGPGKFALEDRQSHLASLAGDSFDMGRCAVVLHKGIHILLTSNKTAPFDLGQWRSQGIDPEEMSVIVVKAAVAHRRAYDPIAARTYCVDTPGPCSSNLKALPYAKVKRPIFPLD